MSSSIDTVKTLKFIDNVFHEFIELWDSGHRETQSNPIMVDRWASGRTFIQVDELDFAAVDEDPSLVLFERNLLQLFDGKNQKIRRFRAVQS